MNTAPLNPHTRALLEAPMLPTLLRLGAQRRADGDALVLHAVALGFGLLFSVAMLFGGSWLYTRMGGSGGALEAAFVYSNWVFAGAALVWLFNSLWR